MERPTTRTRRKERRWIILAEDGRHVTVGRHTDPSESEIDEAGKRLRGIGLGGWLAVTEGAYHEGGPLSVMMVREIAPTRESWEHAVHSFLGTRNKVISSPE